MNIREMSIEDIENVLPLYISYYNEREKSCWTEQTARKRINQVLNIEESYSLILEENNFVLGFAMGYFKQYDDIVGYTLEEIIVLYEQQNKGLGSVLLQELEKRVKEKGAACVELQAVNDDHRERYYRKNGYKNAENFIMKVKWFN
ncbi:MAG: GNAT family N-acetyltransferase [Corallococcus sp.]|nr:GNAT family N-acetyltransferase [Corallococcus sp.]MCM1360164.1 GNAT family N-acetyltransferase [Corallococcus sp.]MCM1395761.1 GNAT family N-acetyltransferase [Corallococcus sp.]